MRRSMKRSIQKHSRMLKKQGWPGESPMLAQRAVSEDPRWTRAVGDSSEPSSRKVKKET